MYIRTQIHDFIDSPDPSVDNNCRECLPLDWILKGWLHARPFRGYTPDMRPPSFHIMCEGGA